LTARVAAKLECWIRDDPDQWRWTHWRWKTRPDGTEEQYGRTAVRAALARADRAPTSMTGPMPIGAGPRERPPA
jgi:hypothetical protein